MEDTMPGKTLMLIGAPLNITAGVTQIADELKFDVKLIQKAEYNRSIKTILGIGKAKTLPPDYEGDALPEPVLLIYGLSNTELQYVLDALRSKLIPISLKAMVTKININWTPKQLYNALSRERAAMR